MSRNPSHLFVQLLCFQQGHLGVKGCEGFTPIIRIARTRARTYRERVEPFTTLHTLHAANHWTTGRRGGFDGRR